MAKKITLRTTPNKGSVNNSPVRESFQVSPNRLTQRSPFQDLYPIDTEVLARITAHMKANGYDNGQPITVWKHELPNGEEERSSSTETHGLRPRKLPPCPW